MLFRNSIVGAAVALAMTACGGDEPDTTMVDQTGDTASVGTAPSVPATSTSPIGSATATLRDGQGAEVGTVTFTQEGSAVRLSGNLTSLPPGEHGFHVHQVGSCEAPSFDSAGDHFNPTNASHGSEHPQGPHAGDLLNLQVGDDGSVQVNVSNDLLSLQQGQPNSVFDSDRSALIVHADPDDYKTQPSGDAGARLACGVIEG